MTTANVKSMAAKAMVAAMVAGGLMLAAPARAEGQGFAVEIGYPHYDYTHRDAFDYQRREEFRRHEEFERREAIRRHEEWERAHRYGFRGQDFRDRDFRGYDRR